MVFYWVYWPIGVTPINIGVTPIFTPNKIKLGAILLRQNISAIGGCGRGVVDIRDLRSSKKETETSVLDATLGFHVISSQNEKVCVEMT